MGKNLIYIFLSLTIPITLFVVASRIDIRNHAQEVSTESASPDPYQKMVQKQNNSIPITSTQKIIPSPTALPPFLKKGDIDNNNIVDVIDLSILLSNWQEKTTKTPDINRDGIVNIIDLSILLSNWEK